MRDLKQRPIRGGFCKMRAQGADYALRIGSWVVMARFLTPKDVGLVAMVTAFKRGAHHHSAQPRRCIYDKKLA
jgi:O-antigen/teichoic acid export membrane protein